MQLRCQWGGTNAAQGTRVPTFPRGLPTSLIGTDPGIAVDDNFKITFFRQVSQETPWETGHKCQEGCRREGEAFSGTGWVKTKYKIRRSRRAGLTSLEGACSLAAECDPLLTGLPPVYYLHLLNVTKAQKLSAIKCLTSQKLSAGNFPVLQPPGKQVRATHGTRMTSGFCGSVASGLWGQTLLGNLLFSIA